MFELIIETKGDGDVLCMYLERDEKSTSMKVVFSRIKRNCALGGSRGIYMPESSQLFALFTFYPLDPHGTLLHETGNTDTRSSTRKLLFHGVSPLKGPPLISGS